MSRLLAPMNVPLTWGKKKIGTAAERA